MLQNPSPNDWLMYSRTYDAQRFSPLNQITKQNVGQLKQVWSKDMVTGTQESIPLVHDGVMYVMNPGAPGIAGGRCPLGAGCDKRQTHLGIPTARRRFQLEGVRHVSGPDLLSGDGDSIVALDMRTGAGSLGNQGRQQWRTFEFRA